MSAHSAANPQDGELSALRAHYLLQESVANYPLKLRLRTMEEALTEIVQGINIDENLIFIAAVLPTLQLSAEENKIKP
jgi:hypothetical protein